ncbi:MAG: SAM-dependent DNA methyltransferase [Flavobacteriales bacterium]|nr:SAM-dependent DNA methyltransferase [Flavobacteriales bacterium]
MAEEKTTTARKAAKSIAKANEPLGFETELWRSADLMRGKMDASEYKHVVLGLLFLKYISDAFAEARAEIKKNIDDPEHDDHLPPGLKDREAQVQAILEDRDQYTMNRVFWVPKEARWEHIRAQATLNTLGKTIDDAMLAVERENAALKNVLPKDYAHPDMAVVQLAPLINLISGMMLGDKESRGKDVLGRVYEYFLSQFASAEGKNSGEFYTPRSVVNTLVRMLAPYKGRVYDPCSGSGGMFVLSEKFVEEHGGRVGDISIFGQESNPTTWRLCKMNLAIRGIECDLGPEPADTFHRDLHPDQKFDYILANPPFNIKTWGGEHLRNDVRWSIAPPPEGNANYAWVQHILHHLKPHGVAGFVLSNGSMSGKTGGEDEIRKQLIERDLVDCMVSLPGQLFYSTAIPVCLWFLARDKKNGRGREGRALKDRSRRILFINASKLKGEMVGRTHRVLTEEEINRVANTYHNWRGDGDEPYEDVSGFSKSATLEDVRLHKYILTPGRYVGAAAGEEDGEPFDKKYDRLNATLISQLDDGSKLDDIIRTNLANLTFDNE